MMPRPYSTAVSHWPIRLDQAQQRAQVVAEILIDIGLGHTELPASQVFGIGSLSSPALAGEVADSA